MRVPAGRASHAADRTEGIVFAPVQVNLERVKASACVVNEPFAASGDLLNRWRIDTQNLTATKKRIVFRDGAGVPRNEHVAAVAQGCLGKPVTTAARAYCR